MESTAPSFNFYKHLMTKSRDIEDLKNSWFSLLAASERLATQNIVNFVIFLTGFNTKLSIHDSTMASNYSEVINQTIQNVSWQKDMYLFNCENWFIRRVEEFLHRIIVGSSPNQFDMPWFTNFEKFTCCLLIKDQKQMLLVGTYLRIQILISLSHVRHHLTVENANLKRHCIAFQEGLGKGFSCPSLPLAKKFCELIETFPLYYVVETPYVRKCRILFGLSEFNITIISLRMLRKLVMSDNDEISHYVRMLIIDNANTFFQLLSSKDPLWLTECIQLFISLHQKHDFSPGIHAFHGVINNQNTFFNLMITGTKTVRSLASQYLLLFITPRVYLYYLTTMPSFNGDLDQIIVDTWKLDIYCNWRFFIESCELNCSSNNSAILIMFLKAIIQKLTFDIETKMDPSIEMEYLQTFFDVIDSLYHSLKDEKRCQVNLMRILESIDVKKLKDTDQQTREIITNCLGYFYRIIIADYREYINRQPYQKQQYEEVDIIFKLCLEWNQVCGDLQFVEKMKTLLGDCRFQFLQNRNESNNPNEKLYMCSDKFEFAVMNFAIFLKQTRMMLISPIGLDHLWNIYLPSWVKNDLNMHISCKIALLSICTNIICHYYNLERVQNCLLERMIVMDYLEILGPKLIGLCEDGLKKDHTVSLFGKGEIFDSGVYIIRVYSNEILKDTSLCNFNVPIIYLELLGRILEYVTIDYKDARCLKAWLSLFEEENLPENTASSYVLQHFGKATPFDGMLLKLIKLLYLRQSNGSLGHSLTKVMSKIIFTNGSSEEAITRICNRFVQVMKYNFVVSTEKRTKLFVDIIRSSLENEIVSRKVLTSSRIRTMLSGVDLMLKDILKSSNSSRQLLVYLQSIKNDLSLAEKEIANRIERSLLLSTE